MAETVAELPDGRDWYRRQVSGMYPWAQWFDGQIWALHHSVDFNGPLRLFRALCYKEAAKFDQTIRTKVVNGVLYVQCIVVD